MLVSRQLIKIKNVEYQKVAFEPMKKGLWSWKTQFNTSHQQLDQLNKAMPDYMLKPLIVFPPLKLFWSPP